MFHEPVIPRSAHTPMKEVATFHEPVIPNTTRAPRK
jgi:hypothetical protein